MYRSVFALLVYTKLISPPPFQFKYPVYALVARAGHVLKYVGLVRNLRIRRRRGETS